MSITWGTQSLNITKYDSIPGPIYITEKELIPDPYIGRAVPQSVLMSKGRKRDRKIIEGFDTVSIVENLIIDYQTQTHRSLRIDFDNTYTKVMMISELVVEYKIAISKAFYRMTLVEVYY